MYTNGMQTSPCRCYDCRGTFARRPRLYHPTYLLITCCSLGLFLPIWLVDIARASIWRCANCRGADVAIGVAHTQAQFREIREDIARDRLARQPRVEGPNRAAGR